MKCASQVPVAYGPYGLFVTLLLATPPVHATLVDLAAHGRGTEGTHAANLLKNLLEDVHADGKIMDGIGPEAAGLAEAALAALAGQNAEEVGRQDLVALGGPGGLLGKGLGGFSASVLGFQRSINQTHRETKERLANLTRGVHNVCSTRMLTDSHKGIFVTAETKHRQCRDQEASATTCVQTRTALQDANANTCGIDILTKPPAAKCETSGNYAEWLSTNLGKYKQLAEDFKDADVECDKAIEELAKHKKCQDPSPLKRKCDAQLTSVEEALRS